MDEIILEFKLESQRLARELLDLLDEAEGNFNKKHLLETYGQVVDRIMGGAKSLKASGIEDPKLDDIGHYGEICKLVGYKGSQITGNQTFYEIVIALLTDATETLQLLILSLDGGKVDLQDYVRDTFLDRLRWVSGHFDGKSRGSVLVDGEAVASEAEVEDDSQSLVQDEIDALLGKLGIGKDE